MAFCSILDKHAPIKMKMLTHNSNSFMTKNLRKAVMHRSKFKNRFNNVALMKTGAIIKPSEIKTLKPLLCKPHKENKRTIF